MECYTRPIKSRAGSSIKLAVVRFCDIIRGAATKVAG
jgi:hypothetical protein